MGAVFELIADEALEKLDDYYTECHVCDAVGVDLYQYQGRQYDADGNPLDESEDAYAACAQCIMAGRLTHICDFQYIETIEKYVAGLPLADDEQVALVERLISKYQRTPDIPGFMQYEDRPLCCGDITEFTGHPHDYDELLAMCDACQYWEDGSASGNESVDFRKDGPPESFSDVAGFKCRHCGQRYFTFQFT